MKLNKSLVSAVIVLVGLMTIIGLSGFNSLFGGGQSQPVDISPVSNLPQPLVMGKISFDTSDQVKISADLYGVQNSIGWLILIHMLPATKESYADLAQRFQNIGYESLAFDLRGHGESGGDAQAAKSILDLQAAADYLIENRGATPDKIYFIGASIGANLALQYISEHQEFKTAILLSAGLDYQGIKTEPLVKNLKAGQKVFFVSSRDDDDNAAENQKLYDLTAGDISKKIKIYDNAGHGTDILETQPDLMSLIIEFI